MDTLLTYIFGLLLVQTICLIWFYSPFRTSLGRLFVSRDIYTNDEFETWILLKAPLLGKLLSCYICFSFWTSLAVGGVSVYILNYPLYTPLITAFSYPSLCYLYKSIVDRS